MSIEKKKKQRDTPAKIKADLKKLLARAEKIREKREDAEIERFEATDYLSQLRYCSDCIETAYEGFETLGGLE